ncbi:MAG: glycosyltransferase [Terriglobales bacterium]
MHRSTTAARLAARSDLKTKSQPASSAWVQEFLLFALFFAGLMLLHAPLLRLPYFWDEAGYYVPAARDLFLTGTLIPQSTLSNAHPPLVMAWLALAWRVAGYSTLVTRAAMLALSAFSLLGLFRLSRVAANLPVAWATTALVALYPVYFTQSSLAQVDLPAAGFTFWALAAYIEDRPWKQVLWFSLAALAKETAILAPLALFGWELLGYFIRLRSKESSKEIRWKEILPPAGRRTPWLYLLLPVVPLAGWYAYHYSKTGFLLGNPEFFRYNVAATLNPLRVPLALGMRLWQLFGYFGLYLLTLAGLLAMLRPPQTEKKLEKKTESGVARPRIAIRTQAACLTVLLAYLAFMSAVGGAVLARYMLPVVPLVILALVSTLWRRVRHWKLIVGAVAIAFVAGLFSNPPYGFSLEDNLAYRDYIVMHAEASRFLAMRYSGQRVLTAWPASDELTRPWLGYINASQPFRVVRIEDFSVSQIDVAASARARFDVALVFSTKYQPPHPLFEHWEAWQRTKEKFFGYHRDLLPEDIAQRLGGTIPYRKERNGQWIAVIAVEREQDAKSAKCCPAVRSLSHPHQVAGMRLDHDPDALAGAKLESIARRQR